MNAGEPILYSLYVYAPNKEAPAIFAALYAVSTALHIWQCYHHNAFKLMGLHVACGILFVSGYSLRAYGARDYLYSPDSLRPLLVFIFSQVFIYVSPPLLELCNYHVLGRIFYYVPYCSPFPPGRVLATFGGIMIIVEALNGLGVSLSVNSSSSYEVQAIGNHLTIAAISLQLGVILIFIGLAGLFHWRCKNTTVQIKVVSRMLLVLYGSMFLIFARCIYRLVEHTGGTNKDLGNLEVLQKLSPILRYELFFYVFEATLMLINSLLWNIWNPGRFLPKNYNVYLGPDGNEIEGEEQADSRPLWAKVVNVVSFGVLCRKQRQTGQFQELVSLGGDGT